MRIEPFQMEREQSQWENVVDYNLAESGVHPMALHELLEGRDAGQFLETRLGYCQTNGTVELRGSISRLYPGAGADNVLVTSGACEANFLGIWKLLEPGDEMVLMLPNYMQIWGLARAFGANVIPFRLREDAQWALDLDELRRAISARTKLIAVCNPNNPTGAVLTESEMQAIADAAANAGAWLLADEVYQGAERDGITTPSFWGRYEKVLITNGLSKAYGLPGLRIGWVAGPARLIAELWACHDYTTIAAGTLNEMLARVALGNRARILDRTRRILRDNYPVMAQWIGRNSELFSIVPPRAGAIAYIKYSLDINSTELARKLREEKSVLIVPGDHFGMDRYLRVNYGAPAAYLEAGLARIQTMLDAGARGSTPERPSQSGPVPPARVSAL
jgi:aspartate/methionine/tyrosine aminotransferase